MMKDGMAPDSVETRGRERQALRIRMDEIHRNVIRRCPLTGLLQIVVGEFQRGDARPSASQNHGRHAVSAADVKHVAPGDVAELVESESKPGLVIEIFGVGKAEQGGIAPERGGPVTGLLVVEIAFAAEPVHEAQTKIGAWFWPTPRL
jgi:hypothetical protein